MNKPCLQVTFSGGRPVAAYYRLPRTARRRGRRAVRAEPGMVVKYDRSGRPLGIEITEPGKLTLKALNRVLHRLGFAAATHADLAMLEEV